jgi:hypothetical protein
VSANCVLPGGTVAGTRGTLPEHKSRTPAPPEDSTQRAPRFWVLGGSRAGVYMGVSARVRSGGL